MHGGGLERFDDAEALRGVGLVNVGDGSDRHQDVGVVRHRLVIGREFFKRVGVAAAAAAH